MLGRTRRDGITQSSINDRVLLLSAYQAGVACVSVARGQYELVPRVQGFPRCYRCELYGDVQDGTDQQARRSYYKLSAKSPISDDQLLWIVGEAVKHTPTAFNSQSGRAVLVLGDRHQELWDVVFAHHKETLKGDGGWPALA